MQEIRSVKQIFFDAYPCITYSTSTKLNICTGIHLHMDGARIWEASGSQKYDIHHTNNCQEIILNISKHFDSIYVSFYKGLGGITGAMLLGTNDFISKARVWQRRFG